MGIDTMIYTITKESEATGRSRSSWKRNSHEQSVWQITWLWATSYRLVQCEIPVSSPANDAIHTGSSIIWPELRLHDPQENDLTSQSAQERSYHCVRLTDWHMADRIDSITRSVDSPGTSPQLLTSNIWIPRSVSAVVSPEAMEMCLRKMIRSSKLAGQHHPTTVCVFLKPRFTRSRQSLNVRDNQNGSLDLNSTLVSDGNSSADDV